MRRRASKLLVSSGIWGILSRAVKRSLRYGLTLYFLITLLYATYQPNLFVWIFNYVLSSANHNTVILIFRNMEFNVFVFYFDYWFCLLLLWPPHEDLFLYSQNLLKSIIWTYSNRQNKIIESCFNYMVLVEFKCCGNSFYPLEYA